ncbi:DUF4435 domain-containing protein [Bacillus mycoides]|uniref:DUF4435 domain-containing protein n=1 Tax=Bacillus mycoides TaxID=1405 RepID=UPI001C0166C3|nr:DUF4435 domain-containing protein [Bacillus mycoides]QWH04605.1 DUF4435 domain-containing protein [Bacillus mycoides]
MKNIQYIEQLKKIDECIRNLREFWIWFNNNKDVLKLLINKDRERTNNETIEKFYVNLPHRIKQQEMALDQLEYIINDLSEKDLEPQYSSFLNKDLLSINWGNFHIGNGYNIDRLRMFEKVIQSEAPLQEEQYYLLDTLANILQSGNSLEEVLIHKVAAIGIFNKIQGLNQNIVMIGANGSGKSRFARSLDGKIAGGISIIPAQKILIYNNQNEIYVNKSMIESVKDFQKKTKLASEQNFIELLTSDLKNLVLALLEERLEKAESYYETDRKQESLLDKTIKIWESLITHRKIVRNGKYKIFVETNEGFNYEFNELSDGEKVVFYYIGHVLLAEQDSYILIDEPENHLHLSICNKLWDILELSRPDCKFIYITHDLDFAVSRNQKSLIWNKNYAPPFSWDFEIVQENDAIPEILMLEIMGSRRNILFCEGDDRNSLDYKIYSRLFKHLNVIPVKGHDEVIRYCTTFNRNKTLSGLTVYGIIDGDVWSPEEIESKRKDNIYVLPFNEIENAICQKEILEKVVKLFYGEEDSVEEFINEFFKEIQKKKEQIAVWYANNRINNYLKHNLFKANKKIEGLKSEIETFLNGENIESFYKEMLDRIEADLSQRNYDSLLKYVDAKKTLTKHLGNNFIIKDFETRFIKLLDGEPEFSELLYTCIVKPYLKELV